MRIFIGTSGYSYAAWKGKFYPPRTAAKDMLGFYAQHFGTVEINNTFYRMPTPAVLEAWAAQVPQDFRFTLKVPRRITHERRLGSIDVDLAYFLEVSAHLGARLGPLLFQTPPNLHRDDVKLEKLLTLLPLEAKAAFEFRHASWFAQPVYDLLAKHRAALAVTETDEAPAGPVVPTADFCYARLRRSEYSDAELEAWLTRLQAPGVTQAYVYFKHEDDARGPAFAMRVQGMLKR
ncbi:MAG TPA: DUF72 domain-containing protein [Burkholderiales bacterium]|nr:DUF72 domain-containing protein [Burkholderiales bacterium]